MCHLCCSCISVFLFTKPCILYHYSFLLAVFFLSFFLSTFRSYFSSHSARAFKQHLRANAFPNTFLAPHPGIAIGADAEHEGTEVVCHSSFSSPISWQFHVVHKLSPSRARRTKVAVLVRHRRPYGKEGDGGREWRRCRLIFSHRINPAPASRRGLILHVAQEALCVRVTCESSVERPARSPAYRPNDLPSYR